MKNNHVTWKGKRPKGTSYFNSINKETREFRNLTKTMKAAGYNQWEINRVAKANQIERYTKGYVKFRTALKKQGITGKYLNQLSEEKVVENVGKAVSRKQKKLFDNSKISLGKQRNKALGKNLDFALIRGYSMDDNRLAIVQKDGSLLMEEAWTTKQRLTYEKKRNKAYADFGRSFRKDSTILDSAEGLKKYLPQMWEDITALVGDITTLYDLTGPDRSFFQIVSSTLSENAFYEENRDFFSQLQNDGIYINTGTGEFSQQEQAGFTFMERKEAVDWMYQYKGYATPPEYKTWTKSQKQLWNLERIKKFRR